MHRGFGREGDTGVHTVEGSKAGSRAAGLTQQRAADQEAYEAKKRRLEEDSARGVGRIDDKFDSTVLNTVLSGGGLQTKASYWDGSGHRRTLEITKGHTIAKFLAASLAQLEHEFPDLRRVHVDNLMYVKEDLVIPHHFTFHDLIVSRARGTSGPLFRFDAKDDVRLGPTDVRVESDATHPGKVVMRAWFERNKHIFTASRWEPYDPAVARDDRYTVRGLAP
ncbi:hypothetical protein JL721_13186 [Aureococcus anophagefferens]|nr:hypothetical protein JL721_13186 [Aureococcus anophagefferens]